MKTKLHLCTVAGLLWLCLLPSNAISQQFLSPTLAIQRLANGQLQITWISISTNLVLEQADASISPRQWTPVPQVPLMDGDRAFVVVVPTHASSLWRLHALSTFGTLFPTPTNLMLPPPVPVQPLPEPAPLPPPVPLPPPSTNLPPPALPPPTPPLLTPPVPLLPPPTPLTPPLISSPPIPTFGVQPLQPLPAFPILAPPPPFSPAPLPVIPLEPFFTPLLPSTMFPP